MSNETKNETTYFIRSCTTHATQLASNLVLRTKTRSAIDIATLTSTFDVVRNAIDRSLNDVRQKRY
jgi:hypothetical protein